MPPDALYHLRAFEQYVPQFTQSLKALRANQPFRGPSSSAGFSRKVIEDHFVEPRGHARGTFLFRPGGGILSKPPAMAGARRRVAYIADPARIDLDSRPLSCQERDRVPSRKLAH